MCLAQSQRAKQRAAAETGALRSWEAAACGSLAGAVAAAATTPLDVMKTRIMLSKVRKGQ